LRERHGIATDAKVVCGVFRLAEEKQPLVFLKAIRRLARRMPNVRVLIAGDGDLRSAVEQFVDVNGLRNVVTVLGRVSDVGGVLDASDLLLMTSDFEGCPNAALEAQFMGVPVVATAVGGLPDAVIDGRTGFLVPARDVDRLAAAAEKLLADDALRLRFGRAGRQLVQTSFSLDRMVSEHEQIYAQMLSGSRFQRIESSLSIREEAVA
jgi:glycosyltransferase involved in cell wall biosynthesis